MEYELTASESQYFDDYLHQEKQKELLNSILLCLVYMALTIIWHCLNENALKHLDTRAGSRALVGDIVFVGVTINQIRIIISSVKNNVALRKNNEEYLWASQFQYVQGEVKSVYDIHNQGLYKTSLYITVSNKDHLSVVYIQTQQPWDIPTKNTKIILAYNDKEKYAFNSQHDICVQFVEVESTSHYCYR